MLSSHLYHGNEPYIYIEHDMPQEIKAYILNYNKD